LMTARLEGWVQCLLNLRPVNGGLVGHWCGWIFVASTALFFLFFLTEATSEVGVMGKDWLAGEVQGGEELLILLMYSSIRLLDSSFHGRNSDRIFSSLACCSSFKKI